MTYAGDPKALTEALVQFADTNRSMGEGSLRGEDQARVAALIKKWAPYLGERIEIDGNLHDMRPVTLGSGP